MREITNRIKKWCLTCKPEIKMNNSGEPGCPECGGWGWYWVKPENNDKIKEPRWSKEIE